MQQALATWAEIGARGLDLLDVLHQAVDLEILFFFFGQTHLVHLLIEKARNLPESILARSAPL